MAPSLPDSTSLGLPPKAEKPAKATLRLSDPSRVLIGRAINRARELRGWSLKEFAGQCDRDERQVYRWQTGEDRPHLDVLFALDPVFRQCLIIAFAETAGEGVIVTTRIDVPRMAVGLIQRHAGMSLRDYFAGQALAGSISEGGTDQHYDLIARYCYELADALLAEREKV